MNIITFLQSKKFRTFLLAIAALIALLLIFQLGVYIGLRKADFSYRWGENYHRNFGGPKSGFLPEIEGRDFVAGHGTAGLVIKIDGNTLVVKGPAEAEKTVIVTPQTKIQRGHSSLTINNIVTDDLIVVIGSPQDNGTIEAKLIRIFDQTSPPPMPRPMRQPMMQPYF